VLRHIEVTLTGTIAGVIIVHVNPLPRTRMGRIAWSWFRHPVKSREFPAKQERLVTAEELLLFGV
jgi:hypothetical protein